MRQLAFDLKQQRGGKRPGAGRPRTRPHPGLDGPGVPHLKRPEISRRHPVHVSQRVQPGVGYLRQQGRARMIRDAIRAAEMRFAVRVVHYSIQGNHLHLIVEAEGKAALSQAMKALGIRIAKALNRLAGRSGSVFVDRFHAHELKTPREVANAVRYVVNNFRHHTHETLPPRWRDPFATELEVPTTAPRTWLLRVGWKRAPAERRRGGDEP